MRSAPPFQLRTIPFRSLLMMASSEDSTIAANRCAASISALLVSRCWLGSIRFKMRFRVYVWSDYVPDMAQPGADFRNMDGTVPHRGTGYRRNHSMVPTLLG